MDTAAIARTIHREKEMESLALIATCRNGLENTFILLTQSGVGKVFMIGSVNSLKLMRKGRDV